MKNKIQLFLVDDDAFYLKLLEMEFNLNSNYDVKTFASGELCIEALQNKPDAIILDYNLDSIDKNAINGLQTLDLIKAFRPNTPVVMLSSENVAEMENNRLNSRAFDYLVKGKTTFGILHHVINSIFVDRRLRGEINF